MWSGPRNLSTTMMRSFSSRADCACIDEPFYAPWLKTTGAIHPMRDEILAAHPFDADQVIANLAHGIHKNRPLQYEKHMTHHLHPSYARDWFGDVIHAFLIRHPARVLASYAAKMDTVSLEAIGFPQQAEIFDHVATLYGKTPIVIDSDDILRDPSAMVQKLCMALDISFDPAMLTWPAGVHSADGAWATHWYGAVWQSTGFGNAPGPLPTVESDWSEVYEPAMAIYERLSAYRITSQN